MDHLTKFIKDWEACKRCIIWYYRLKLEQFREFYLSNERALSQPFWNLTSGEMKLWMHIAII
jgi:hypothetical protein